MATRILGLDIGSHFVRGVVLESQGRTVRLTQLIEEPIERAETPLPSNTQESDAVESTDTGEHTATTEAESETAAQAEEAAEPTPIVDPIDERAWDDATRATIERILQRPDFEVDWLIASAPEGAFMYTQIELPFHTDREVRAVLGPQLDDRLPG